MVSTRYGLTGIQRVILYRGIYKQVDAHNRLKKKIFNIEKKSLHVDGYNVIFTIGNYLLGRPLFIGNDDILRDVGESFGKIEDPEYLKRISDIFFEYIEDKNPCDLTFYIDKPVESAGIMAEIVNQASKQSNIPLSVNIHRSPDRLLKQVQNGILLTSDSEILDKAKVRFADLPRSILQSKYNPHFINLKEFAGI